MPPSCIRFPRGQADFLPKKVIELLDSRFVDYVLICGVRTGEIERDLNKLRIGQFDDRQTRKMNRQPKGDCYRIALNTGKALLGCCLSPLGVVKSVVVVHGSVVQSSSGRRIDHAWVEIGDEEVVDRSCGMASEIRKSDYVRKTQAVEEARYSVDEALVHGLKSGHWGPWHK